MPYDKLQYTGVEVEPCDEPPESCLRLGLLWDEVNRPHCTVRLTVNEIESGLRAGYVVYEPDPHESGGRYRILFQVVPAVFERITATSTVWRLIIDTNGGRMRPITVLQESRISAQQYFLQAIQAGEIE